MVVPHRGTGPATQAVIVGDVQVTFVSMGPHIELVRKGVLRVLGSRRRPSACPMCRTCRRSPSRAFPDFTAETWFALFAPQGTPKAILDQLNGYTRGIQEDPEISQAARGELSSIRFR